MRFLTEDPSWGAHCIRSAHMEKKDKDNYMVPIRDTIPTRDVPVVTWLLIGGGAEAWSR